MELSWKMGTSARGLGRKVPATKLPKGQLRPNAGGAKPRPAKVHVFISYAKADNQIATALREEVADINRDRVECFLDSETIASGEGWERKLEDALEVAHWLVCIYTGEQSEFCGYEIGVFTRGKALEKNAGNSQLVCLHDVSNYPAVFRAHLAGERCFRDRYNDVLQNPALRATPSWDTGSVARTCSTRCGRLCRRRSI
jgi:hypothetical protein